MSANKKDSHQLMEETVRDQFKFDIKPLQMNKWLVWSIIMLIPIVGTLVFLPILGRFYFADSFRITLQTVLIIFILSIFLALFCVFDGFFAGWWWKKTGKWLTNLGFLRPLESMIESDKEEGFISGYLNDLIFGKGENFLLYNAIDQDHSTLKKILQNNGRSLQMLTAMFIVVLNFFLSWDSLLVWIANVSMDGSGYLNEHLYVFDVDFQEPLETFILFYITLSIALTILAIVMPLLMITDHTFVYQTTDDKRIVQAASTPRNTIKDTFSIFTILSGFSLIRNDLQIVENPNLLIDLVVFIVLLLLILIYGIPIIYAAFDTYYEEHEEIVNELRDTLRRAGYPILISQTTPVSNEILDQLEVHNQLPIPDYKDIEFRRELLDLALLIKDAGELRDISILKDDDKIRSVHTHVKAQITSRGYSLVETIYIGKTDTQLALAMQNKTLFVAFPGTQGWKDILTDLEVVDSPFDCKPWIMRILSGPTAEEIHKGANRAVCSSIKQIVNYIQANNPDRIIITGHSLGGMLGTVLAGYLVKDFENTEIELFTFANPAVGNRNFADFINSNVTTTLLIANQDDPVPNLLPEFLDYHHIVNKVILGESGKFSNNSFDVIYPSETSRAVKKIIGKKTIPKEHYMDEYIKRLQEFEISK